LNYSPRRVVLARSGGRRRTTGGGTGNSPGHATEQLIQEAPHGALESATARGTKEASRVKKLGLRVGLILALSAGIATVLVSAATAKPTTL